MKNKKKMCFGVIIGTRAYFNSELAKDVRKQLLETLTKEGYDYVILPEDATPTGSSSIETREDGLKCAKLFRENRERIDGIIVSLPNFGFEIGIINAISVADLNVPVWFRHVMTRMIKLIWIAVVTHSVVRFPYAITCISTAFLLLIPPFILILFILICWLPISINLQLSAV